MNWFYEMLSLKGKVSSTRFVYFTINLVAIIIVLICGFVMITNFNKTCQITQNANYLDNLEGVKI